VPRPYDPNWDSLRNGYRFSGLSIRAVTPRHSFRKDGPSSPPRWGRFLLVHHSHAEVNGDGKIANPHQKRAVPPTAHPYKAASAPPVPELGPFLLVYWVMPGQSEAICPQALLVSFNLCLIDLTPG
jgi:hypothetical protein